MNYMAIKVENVDIENFVSWGIGRSGLKPPWSLHSAIASIIIDGKVTEWLVILQSNEI